MCTYKILQEMGAVAKTSLRKEKWTLSFDSRLKRRVVREAKRKGIYPVSLLEQIVRDSFNPFGYTTWRTASLTCGR